MAVGMGRWVLMAAALCGVVAAVPHTKADPPGALMRTDAHRKREGRSQTHTEGDRDVGTDTRKAERGRCVGGGRGGRGGA